MSRDNDDKDRLLLEVGCKLICAIEGLTEYLKHNQNAILHRIEQHLHQIMATQAELVVKLDASLAQQKKTAGEIAALQAGQDILTAKIAELQAIIEAGGTIGQPLIDAVDAVEAQSKVNDELIPDVPGLPPQPGT